MRCIHFAGLLTFAALVVGGSSGDIAKADEAPRITYEDHVKPILREHCFTCHNQNEKKGGLALDTYASTIEGGAGGEVAYDGDSSSSRLWQLMAHEDTPVMPPGQDKLADAKIDVVKNWIDGGLLENSGSKAKKKSTSALSFTTSADGRPEGPPPMPENVWKQPVIVTPRTAAVTAIECSPWAPLAAIAGQNQVVLYNTDNGQLAGVLPFPEGEIQSLSFSRDGGYLLVGGGRHSYQGLTYLYDIKTGDRVARCGDELDIVLGSDINDLLTKVAVGGPKRMVRIHDVATGEQLFELKKHTDWVYSVRFSPDGVLLASGDRAGGLVLWEADTGRLYLDLVGHKDAIRSIAWRADSNVVASASMDGTVKLWDINNGGQIKNISAHGGGVTGIDMARDGRLVTCGKDRLVKLWDANGNPVRDFPAMPEAVLEVAFTHDGTSVIAGDWTGQIVMWKTDDPAQVTQLTSNPPTLETRLEAARVTAQQAQATFEQQNNALSALNDQLAASTTKLTMLTQQLETARAEVQTAELAVVAAQTAVQSAADSLAQMNAEHSTLASEIEGMTAEQARLVAERERALQGSVAAEQALSQAISARDAVVNEIDAFDKQLAENLAAGNTNPEQVADIRAKRDAKAGELATKAQEIAAAISARGTAVQAASDAAIHTKNAIDLLVDRQQKMSDLELRLAGARLIDFDSKLQLNATNIKLAQIKAQIVELEPQVSATQQMVTELTAQRDQTQIVVQQLTGPRDVAAAHVAQLEADLAAFNAARDTLVARETELQAQIASASAEAEARSKEAEQLAEKLAPEDQKLAMLKEQLATLEAQVNELRTLKRQMESAQQEAVESFESAEVEKQKVAERRALFEAAYVKE